MESDRCCYLFEGLGGALSLLAFIIVLATALHDLSLRQQNKLYDPSKLRMPTSERLSMKGQRLSGCSSLPLALIFGWLCHQGSFAALILMGGQHSQQLCS